jgi:hypothetical protein
MNKGFELAGLSFFTLNSQFSILNSQFFYFLSMWYACSLPTV